jgi:hypothetical protein
MKSCTVKQNKICAGEDDICMICSIVDDIGNPERCEFDNKCIDNNCPGFQCSEQCGKCPKGCEFLV